ncbi:MAG TPA: gamma-glutamylcyclotransferase family protein [Fibrobacteria bacterium]|nr:gamma-glutamylcyclotransferase family protein [Fibrobacteria bacterium]
MRAGNADVRDGHDDAGNGPLLFTYGTLMLTTGIPAVDAATRDAGVSLGRGYILGHLFDLGEYPGAVPWPPPAAAAGEGPPAHEDAPKVWGKLLRLKDPAAFYAVIDAYEGFVPGDPASEFIRAETTVFLPESGETHAGQVYYYNLETAGRERIEAGDYLAHWQAKGKPSQGRIQ